MKGYWIYKNGKKYCFTYDSEQAQGIARALIAKENDEQNKRNLFVNIDVTVKEIDC